MDSRRSTDHIEGWAECHQWISRWLEDKTTPRKIREWHGWARGRMENGWTRERVEQRIRDAWHEHSLTGDQTPLEPDLVAALAEVYKLAWEGWTPAQCAVVYRSLYRAYPSRHWLGDWAKRWEEMGEKWQEIAS